MASDQIEHYLTYQHNVQRFFLDHQAKYSGVVVPLSIAMSFPTGTYGFVRALCSRDATKRYAIDPRTPLFQKRWDREKHLRPPHERMASALGVPFSDKGVSRALTPADFRGAERSVAEACLSVQKTFRAREEEKKKLDKYRKMLGVDRLRPLREPQFLIPPYFQFDRVGDEWYRLNLRCIEASREFQGDIPLRPVIHFAGWPSFEDPGSTIGALKEAGVTEVFLYCNNCRELDLEHEQLMAYIHAVRQFADADVAPHVLHGGYFSIIMSKFGLAGFADGVGYGEWRDSGYHRGGSAEIRLYVQRLHRYVEPADAQALIDRDPEYFGSDTALFSEFIESERPLDEVSLSEALDHMMECRAAEVEFVRTHSIKQIAAELTETRAHLRGASRLLFRKFGPPLRKWRKAIRVASRRG